MITQIDHIGVAVKDLEEVLKVYTDILGLECREREVLEAQKIKVAKVQVGESTIELVQATDEEGPIAKFIAKNGEGMHHIAYRVDDIDKTLEEMKEKGAQLIDQVARTGAGGMRIAFLHPKGTRGVLTELVEKP